MFVNVVYTGVPSKEQQRGAVAVPINIHFEQSGHFLVYKCISVILTFIRRTENCISAFSRFCLSLYVAVMC